jgi:hypothetical protein
MKKNMGAVDRTIRVVISVVVAILYYSQIISGLWGGIALVIATVFLLTSLLGFCPLYNLFGWRTCAVEKTPAAGSTT